MRVERESVGTFGQIDANRVFDAFRGVVFGELGTKAAGLNANHRVNGGVEVRRATEFLGGDLILLQGYTGVIEGVASQIAQQSAERFRRVERMAVFEFLDLEEIPVSLRHRVPAKEEKRATRRQTSNNVTKPDKSLQAKGFAL